MKLKYNDEWHSYYLDGVRCKSVTNVAGLLEDNYNVNNWAKRKVALGMAMNPAFAQRALAYQNDDDKKSLQKVAEDALTLAGGHEAAERGSAIHKLIEDHDLGRPIFENAENLAIVAAYDKALEAAGLEVIRDYVERFIVHPDQKIAGKFDRIYKRKRDGKFVIGDIKTGRGAVDYPRKTCIQLAFYINAPFIAGRLPSQGGETEEFEKLPEKIDRKYGYVIYVPGEADENGERNVEVFKLEIAKAWAITQKAIFPALKWNAEKDLVQDVGSVEVADVYGPASDERVAWINGRLDLVKMYETAPEAMQYVVSNWPADVPTRKSGEPWSEVHVDALNALLERTEKNFGGGFPVRDPAHKNMERA